ncbi:uncharacterized protein SPPG_04219 [Spizellomyces punctatus DAOM BR117]|uniref:Uncharacterized protein n=1 Tax=Spizellomyces punctatus (strain DAOM BR117) TaxID=645134 RepID=A0A0L0HJD3_SPIPD|nr:uncharacterized protein SPPG_04219 [Spizellomyces punctatus DAOM BR117]KND01128.1 hypothetical protein SPPG_04219 [Spizellomyces punctatus DAOM BR117]|eukprot:XP_016609167.1 hypothetical protein SPPG_04219 [Spizellomyces punctatus DAOM BR117]
MPFLVSPQAFLCALLFNVVFAGLKLYQDDVRNDPYEKYRAPTSTDTKVSVAEFAIMALCMLNTVCTFRRSKKLLLFRAPTGSLNLIGSPNAKIVSVDVTGAVFADYEDEQAPHEQPTRTWKDKILFWKKPVAVPSPENLRRVWQLTVWDPTDFGISLFWYVQVVIMCFSAVMTMLRSISVRVRRCNWRFYIISRSKPGEVPYP